MDWGEFLSFRKFVTPAVIQVVFWLGVLGVIIGSITQMVVLGSAWGVIGGLIGIVLGVLLVRVWCELIILLFRIYDSLRGIEGKDRGSVL